MLGPTVRPRLEGRVQGVVVQAIKKTSGPVASSVDQASSAAWHSDSLIPFVLVFQYFATACLVVFRDGYLFADVFFCNTQHLLYTQLYGEAMGIPAAFTFDLESFHRLVAAYQVL